MMTFLEEKTRQHQDSGSMVTARLTDPRGAEAAVDGLVRDVSELPSKRRRRTGYMVQYCKSRLASLCSGGTERQAGGDDDAQKQSLTTRSSLI